MESAVSIRGVPRDERSAPAGRGGPKTERELRAGLCGQGLVAGGFPVPGQQLVHPGVRQLGDAGQHIGELGLRVCCGCIGAAVLAADVKQSGPGTSALELRLSTLTEKTHSWRFTSPSAFAPSGL